MKHLYFWQNIPAIHQAAYLRELAEMGYCVTWICDNGVTPGRIKMGWKLPELGKIDLKVNLSREQQLAIIEKQDPENSFNFTIGVRGSRDAQWLTDTFIKRGLKVGWIMEKWDDRGWRGIFRALMYKYYAWKYRKHIACLLAMGDKGVKAYTWAGFPRERVFNFHYVVETPVLRELPSYSEDFFELAYVGSFYELKGIDLLFKALAALPQKAWRLHMIGNDLTNGDYQKLARELKIDDKIVWHGIVSNTEISQFLQKVDLLVLPSRYDGWGAVVNEALQSGTPVVCSDAAGAACVCEGILGEHFEGGNLSALTEALARRVALENKVAFSARKAVAKLAEERLGAKSTAEFLTGGGYSETPYFIGYTGALIKRKGVDFLLRALANLKHKNWQLHIVGDEMEEPTGLKDLAGTLGITERVVWHGMLPNSEATKIMQSLDLFVLPSRFDGWGAVVNEALESGTPCIVSESASSSCLCMGEMGDAFPRGNVKRLTQLLDKWIAPENKITFARRQEIAAKAVAQIGPESTAKFVAEIIEV